MNLSVNITPGVWFCSYVVRVVATTGIATVGGFVSYMSATAIAGVSPITIAYNALQFSCNSVSTTIAVAGNNNLSLTGSGVITSTTSQSIPLGTFIDINSGAISYAAGNYIMATRIA